MASTKPLAGKVCIVTGASRGIGKGIALQLGAAGATVYITGRTLHTREGHHVAGSLEETATEVTERGGECIPVQCDHSKDEDVKLLFDRVSREQDGQLDILVNNAYSGVQALSDAHQSPFWELDPTFWDVINNVGLRNHYVCSVYAAKLMVPRKQGLIVNVSSSAGIMYVLNAAYGIGKEACDRMAADCAVELKKHNVAFVSLWPGSVRTEQVEYILREKPLSEGASDQAKVIEEFLANGESAEFSGLAVCHLATDPNVMKKSGRCFFTADLAREYGFVDINGTSHQPMRSLGNALTFATGNTIFKKIIPGFIKIPCWILCLMSSKF